MLSMRKEMEFGNSGEKHAALYQRFPYLSLCHIALQRQQEHGFPRRCKHLHRCFDLYTSNTIDV